MLLNNISNLYHQDDINHKFNIKYFLKNVQFLFLFNYLIIKKFEFNLT